LGGEEASGIEACKDPEAVAGGLEAFVFAALLFKVVKLVNFRGFLGTTAVNAKSKVKLCISRSFSRLLQKGKRKRTPEPMRELRTAFLKQ
jgi:hypothetical protein